MEGIQRERGCVGPESVQWHKVIVIVFGDESLETVIRFAMDLELPLLRKEEDRATEPLRAGRGVLVVAVPPGYTEELPPGYDTVTATEAEGVGITMNVEEVNEVGAWLKSVGDEYYDQYYDAFVLNGFDSVDVLGTLTDYDLEFVVGVKKMGHRRKLMMEIQKQNNVTLR